MKVIVKNFQSILRTEIEIEGFTVLVGPSNLGKSALLRAISAAIYGLPGDYYIRKGESFTAVGIEDDDFKLVWHKVHSARKIPGRETFIQVNGVLHTKLGRNQYELTKGLGFLEVESSDYAVRPQFANQFDRVFPIDLPDTVVAELMRVLTRGDIVTKAQGLLLADLKKANLELGMVEAQKKIIRDKVAKFEGIDELESTVNDLKEKWSEMKVVGEWLERAKNFDFRILGFAIPDPVRISDLTRNICDWLRRIPPKVEGDFTEVDGSTLKSNQVLVKWWRDSNALLESRGGDQGLEDKLNSDLVRAMKIVDTLRDLIRNSGEPCPTCGRVDHVDHHE